MPHIVLEYSRNLGEPARLSRLLGELHSALGATEGFEGDRIKSRAIPLETFRVGRAEDSGFIHASVTFSRGRPDPVRRELGNRLLAILMQAEGWPGIEVGKSVEIRQFEPGMYFNSRDHGLRRAPRRAG